jgi:hypothetical protein
MSANATAASSAREGRLSRVLEGSLLRVALRVDAVVTAANGIGYLALAGVLDSALGLEAGLLRGVGAFLLAFAAVVWAVAARREIHRGAAAAIVVANVVWVTESLALAAFDWGSPTTAGAVWAVLQALVVAAFAALQATGLRRG